MKLNVFSYVFWPEHFLINELCSELVKNNVSVNVQTSLPNYQSGHLRSGYSFLGPYFEKNEGVNIYRYPVISRKKGFVFLALNYFTNIFFGFFNFFRLPKASYYFHFATSPLLIILPIVLFKKITGAKLIIWYQDLWPESFYAIIKKKPRGIVSSYLNFLVKFIYDNTDYMLVQNPSFIKNLQYYGYKGVVDVMYNWAPRQQIKVDSPALREFDGCKKNENDFVILFAGNLGKAQSLDHVLNVFKKIAETHPFIKLWLAGDGSFLPEVKHFMEHNKIKNVVYLGRKPVESMPYLYNLADVLLVSLSDEEVFNNVIPSKIQSYMYAGKPILGFLNGAGANVISQAKCGIVATAEDEVAFEQAVHTFAHLPKDELNQMGIKAELFYKENFAFEKQVEKVLNILKSSGENN